MILTTTNTIEHHQIANYLGIVTGVSFKKRDTIKGFTVDYNKYYDAMEKALNELKEEAFQKMKTNATTIGGDISSILGVSVTGTAVKVA